MNSTTSSRGGKIGRWLASSIYELAVTFWTCTSFPLMYISGGHNDALLFIPLALGAPLFLALTWNKPIIAHVDPIVTTGVFLLFMSILGSYLFNPNYYEPVFMAGNILSAALLFLTLYVLVMKMDLDFQKLLVFQAIYIVLFMPVVLETSSYVWGRLEPAELHPNYPSMLCIVALLGAMSVRNIFVTLALAALPFYTMLEMQSRASMIAASAAAAIIIGCGLWRMRSRRLMAQLGVAVVVGGVVAMGAALAGYNIFAYGGSVVSDAFLLNDDHRGMDSGATGRSDLWAAAYNIWLTHPIFGIGFKGHTRFMPDNMLAHNAFLGLLADNGLVGLAGYLLIAVGAALNVIKRGWQLPMFPQRAAIIFPYFLYGMVESRAFSFGNTYSILFLLVAFDSAKYRVAKRDAAVPPKAAVTRPLDTPRPQVVSGISR